MSLRRPTRSAPVHPMPYWCATCRQYFSLKTGTALQRSKLPLRAWVLAIFVMTMHRTEEASLPVICETLAVSRRTARSIIRRIRRGTTLSVDLHQPAGSWPGPYSTRQKRGYPTGPGRGRCRKAIWSGRKRAGPVMSIMEVHPDRTGGALSPGGRRGVDGHGLPAGRPRTRDPNVDARDLTATLLTIPSLRGDRRSGALRFCPVSW